MGEIQREREREIPREGERATEMTSSAVSQKCDKATKLDESTPAHSHM